MILLEWLSNGFLNLSAWQIVGVTLLFTHITIISVTVYLHRHSAHRALDLHPVISHFMRFWLWMTTGMLTREWTSIHRKHHAMCETEEDPHSPQVQGLREILFRGAEAYRDAQTPEIMEKYGAGCPNDWVERRVYTRFKYLGIIMMAFINVALFGVIGLTVWAVQMAWIPLFAAGVINGIGHYWGYRNFECPDAARNISPWGILIGGEELHNNHHTYPNSAKLSAKPWEFDLGWFWIKAFAAVGLAKVRSTGPVVARVPGKDTLDVDTAWAILNDRFRVMSRFAEQVVAPMIEEEYHKADTATRKLLKRAKTVLTREDSLVDDAGRNRITQLTETLPDVKQVYELKQGLQAIWGKRGGKGDDLLVALKEWCVAAEQSGVKALTEFVEDLKSYAMPQHTAARA